MVLLALLLLAQATGAMPCATLAPPVVTSQGCPPQCDSALCIAFGGTDCWPRTNASECLRANAGDNFGQAFQCLLPASGSSWTLDLTQLPGVARVENVTYPEDTTSVELLGDARTNVTLDATVFSTPDAVLDFILSGIHFPRGLADSKAFLPSKWQHVTLERTGLDVVPVTLSTMPLRSLNLAFNNLHDLDGAEFPSLETLNLTGNPLTTIPPVVFRMQTLSTLSLRRCNLTNVVVTPAQLEFLLHLHTFDADLAVTTCPEGSTKTSVAITNAVCLQTPATIDVSTMSTSGASQQTVVIIVATAGSIVVVMLLVCCWLCYSRKRSKVEKEFSEPATGQVLGFDHSPRTYWPVVSPCSPDENSEQTCCQTGQSLGAFSPDEDSPRTCEGGFSADEDVFLADEARFAGSAAWNALFAFRISQDEVSLWQPLATSELCQLWRGAWHDRAVVVKRLAPEVHHPRHADALATTTYNVLAALATAGISSHPNIVEILGVTWTKMLTFSVVMPLMEGWDLRSLLDTDDAASLTWADTKCALAINVADALVFVQAHEKTLEPSTCLLSSRNVLLDANSDARLSLVQFDLGMEMAFSFASIAPRYVAPEVLSFAKWESGSAFVYAFGVLLTELDTLQRPFDDVVNPNGSKASDPVILSRIAKHQLQPTVSDECPESIAALVRACCSFDASARPTAPHVAYTLRRIWKDEL